MSSKKAWLMLIRLHTGKLHVVLPLSLGVLEEALDALTDLVGFFNPLVRSHGIKIYDLMRMTGEVLSNIRSYPRLQLVKIDTDEVRVQVDLY